MSVERIREALRNPVVLRLPPPEDERPVFRVEVEEFDWGTPTILETIRRELASSPGSPAALPTGRPQPLASVDLLQLAIAIRNTIGASRRAGAERDIRRRVQEELAAFCDIHDCSIVEGEGR